VSASRPSIDCDGGTGSQVIADPRDNPFPDALYPAGVGGIIGTVGGLRLERWAPSRRNGGRHQIGIGGRLTSEFAHNLRTLLTYGGAFVAAVVAAAIGGAVWDHSNQVATVRSTEAGVSAAFRDGQAAAANWLNLMRSNDPAQALAACTGINVRVIEGRRACNLPVWLDPPIQNAPR